MIISNNPSDVSLIRALQNCGIEAGMAKAGIFEIASNIPKVSVILTDETDEIKNRFIQKYPWIKIQNISYKYTQSQNVDVVTFANGNKNPMFECEWACLEDYSKVNDSNIRNAIKEYGHIRLYGTNGERFGPYYCGPIYEHHGKDLWASASHMLCLSNESQMLKKYFDGKKVNTIFDECVKLLDSIHWRLEKEKVIKIANKY